MQAETPDTIRNIALAGHNDSGKTTLTSAALLTGDVVNRFLRVEDRNTVTDFDHEEMERGISIGLGTCFVPWQKHKINLLDCPGYGIFFTETKAGMRAADATLLCVSAVSGIEVNTEKVWSFAEEIGAPVAICLTKMDRERADFRRVVEQLRTRFGREVAPVQVPIGKESSFSGLVDLLHGTAQSWAPDGDGKGTTTDAPAEASEMAEEFRNDLIEAVAETDDALLEKFFEDGTLTDDELSSGLKKAINERKIVPVFVTSALHNIGTSALLDDIVELMPSPSDRPSFPATDIGGADVELLCDPEGQPAALLFKTLSDPFSGKISLFRVVRGTIASDSPIWNASREDNERLGHLMAMQGKQGSQVKQVIAGDIGGVAKLKHSGTGDSLTSKEAPLNVGWISIPEAAISFAIEPKSKGDEEKIGEALHRLMEEDPTIGSGRDQQTGEYLLSGTGQLHVEIAVAKLKSRSKVEVILHPPKVPYREAIKRKAEGHGRHKKQSGGRGQFADCKVIMEPLPTGNDIEFADEIFGGAIPQTYRPAVDKGIREAAARGYLAGYPVSNFKVRLIDGQYHDVDSSELAFKIAGSLAFKDAMANARPTILEPMMLVEITTTEEFTGDVMGDLSQRRGRPQGMDTHEHTNTIRAIVPMSEMLNYAPSLRSMTQGRASFHMEFAQYEEAPKPIQQKIIAAAQREAADADG